MDSASCMIVLLPLGLCCLAGGALSNAFSADVVRDEWLLNRRGIEALDDNFVLPPFTPVVASPDGRADVWGRQYQLDPWGLIQQVTIGGKPFFQKPMEFEIELAGRRATFAPQGRLLSKSAPGRAQWIARGTSAGARLEIKTTVEYDGMVRIDWTIVPQGRLTLTGFRYRIRYPGPAARFLHYVGARSTPESQNLPRNSYSRAVPEGEGPLWQSPFKTLVWLGDYERGFLWFCGSEQHWSPQERRQRPGAICVRRAGGEVVLQIAPVTRPYVLDGPATYSFGLFATPVRPPTKGWRGWTCDYRGPAEAVQKAHPGLQVKLVYLSGMHAAPFYEAVKDPLAYRRAADEIHARGQAVMQYFDPTLMALGRLKDPGRVLSATWQPPDLELDRSGTTAHSDFAWKPPEFPYYPQWKTEPGFIVGYRKEDGYRQYTVAAGSRFADLFCRQIEEHARAGCDGAIDVDEWYPVPDMNPRHGMGYVDQDGVRRAEYDWWAKRDLMKRLCAVFLKVRGRPPIIIAHTAAMLTIPCTSFCDGILTGENLNTGYFCKDAYFDQYFQNRAALQECLKRGGENWYYYAAPPDRWAVECLGKQFGFAVLTMANLTKSKELNPDLARSERATRDMLAMAVVHDNLVWPIFCDQRPVIRLWQARQEFGIADDDVEFLPFWGPRHLATASAPGVVVSSYRKAAKWLINVANLGLTPQTFALRILDVDPRAVGDPGPRSAPSPTIAGRAGGHNGPAPPGRSIRKLWDAETGKEFFLTDGGAVTISLRERDYALIRADLQ